MLIPLIIVTLLYQTILTVGSVLVWRSVMKNNAAQLPKVFFAITTMRLVASVAFFALALWLIHTQVEEVKLFTIFFLVLYMLLLGFDTAYFYCSSQKINNKK